MRHWIKLLTIALFATSLGGCPGPISPTVELDKFDNGRTVIVPALGRIVLELASNPSTGYAWQITTLDTSIVSTVSHNYTASFPVLPGSGGTDRWVFQAVASGVTPLTLEYRGPGQPAQVGDTFSVSLVVNLAQ